MKDHAITFGIALVAAAAMVYAANNVGAVKGVLGGA